MTVTLEATITVGMPDLRKAITSVVVHAEPTKTGDDISALSRVRLTAGADELLVMATNTTTTALAAVPIEEDSRAERFAADDAVFSIDLPPGVLRNILQAFRVSKASSGAEPQWAELAMDANSLVVTDVSALFPGLSLTIPTLGLADDFPDVLGTLARAMGSASASPKGKPLVSQGQAVALFRKASQAYGAPLQFEASGTAESRGFTILCGPSFIGLVSSRHNDDDSLKRRDAERHIHMQRLGLGKAMKAVG